jgi:hypothetical protein
MANKKSVKAMATLRPARPLMTLATKKAAVPASTAATGTVIGTKVTQMPQSLAAGAISQGIFLYTNDLWAQRYFDPNDLHSVERELFG